MALHFCSSNGTQCRLIRERLTQVLDFLDMYHGLINAYVSNYFTHELAQLVPPLWWKCLSQCDPPELCSLLQPESTSPPASSLHPACPSQSPPCRRVWPLSLLAYRAALHDLALSRHPVKDSAIFYCGLTCSSQKSRISSHQDDLDIENIYQQKQEVHNLSPTSDHNLSATSDHNPSAASDHNLSATSDHNSDCHNEHLPPVCPCSRGNINRDSGSLAHNLVDTDTNYSLNGFYAQSTGHPSGHIPRSLSPDDVEHDDVKRDDVRGGRDDVRDGQYVLLEHCYRRHVKPKKQHEITTLARVIAAACDRLKLTSVVDVGAGQGHLSRLLSFGYGLNVTTVEADSGHGPKAAKFDSEVKRDLELGRFTTCQKRKHGGVVCDEALLARLQVPIHVVGRVEEDMSDSAFVEMLSRVSGYAPSEDSEGVDVSEGRDAGGQTKLLMTGLHACGPLTSTMLRVFVQSGTVQAIAAVGCCYMKMVDSSGGGGRRGVPLSACAVMRGARGLTWEALEMACHAAEQYAQRLQDNAEALRCHAYRAALQYVIARRHPDFTHGQVKITVKRVHELTFSQYAEKALQRLHLPCDLTGEELAVAELQLTQWRQVVAFFTLRLSLAPLIETAILLDRVLYLLDHGVCGCLAPIFDPQLSPRNFVILAWKK